MDYFDSISLTPRVEGPIQVHIQNWALKSRKKPSSLMRAIWHLKSSKLCSALHYQSYTYGVSSLTLVLLDSWHLILCIVFLKQTNKKLVQPRLALFSWYLLTPNPVFDNKMVYKKHWILLISDARMWIL